MTMKHRISVSMNAQHMRLFTSQALWQTIQLSFTRICHIDCKHGYIPVHLNHSININMLVVVSVASYLFNVGMK